MSLCIKNIILKFQIPLKNESQQINKVVILCLNIEFQI